MLDCNRLLRTICSQRRSADFFTLEQQGGTPMRILHQQLRWSSLLRYGGLMGCDDYLRSYQSKDTVVMYTSQHVVMRRLHCLETCRERHLPRWLCFRSSTMHSILEGAVQAEELCAIRDLPGGL